MADLLVRSAGEKLLQITGLFLKRYNDAVPLNFFEGISFSSEALTAAISTQSGKLRLSPDLEVDSELITITASSPNAIVTLKIPDISGPFTTNYINFAIARRGVGELRLLTL